jgi:hypothetical protein
VEAHIPAAGTIELSPRLVEHLGLQVEQLEPAGRQPARDLHAEQPGSRPYLEDLFGSAELEAIDELTRRRAGALGSPS